MRLLTALLVGCLVLGVVVLVLKDDDGGAPGGRLAEDPGISHAHGLGVNPADGSLIVATHYGSFRLPAGSDEAERIGGSFQDTMGFTVVGPDQFLGSGHPDLQGLQAGQPGSLGLIESDDAGRTWAAVSLSGRVDFHGLAFAHGLVYGWDSGTGRFMVSSDRKEWDNRSTVNLHAFGVDPDDADHIIGATPDGPVESTDGGRTWIDVPGPDVVTLSWDLDIGLWAGDQRGGVWHRTGTEWQPAAGTVDGPVQVILATPDALHVAANGPSGAAAIYRSNDQGETWSLLYQDPA